MSNTFYIMTVIYNDTILDAEGLHSYYELDEYLKKIAEKKGDVVNMGYHRWMTGDGVRFQLIEVNKED